MSRERVRVRVCALRRVLPLLRRCSLPVQLSADASPSVHAQRMGGALNMRMSSSIVLSLSLSLSLSTHTHTNEVG